MSAPATEVSSDSCLRHRALKADYTVTPQLQLPLHIKRGAYFTALVHHVHGRHSRLVRGWIPREPREPLLERLVRNPRGRRRGELALLGTLLRAALRGEPPHLRRGGRVSGQGRAPRRGAPSHLGAVRRRRLAPVVVGEGPDARAQRGELLAWLGLGLGLGLP